MDTQLIRRKAAFTKLFCGLFCFRLGLARAAHAGGSFGLSGHFIARCADRRRQDRGIKAGRFTLIGSLITARAALLIILSLPNGAARTQTARATRGFAHERVFSWLESRFSGLLARMFTRILDRWLDLDFCAGAALFAPWPILTRSTFGTLGTIFALGPIFALGTILILRAIIAGLAIITLLIITREIVVSVEIARILALVTTFSPAFARAIALIVLTDALIGDDAEIMVRELQVIFGLNAITIEVRIMRQLAILLEHLRRITARTAVDPVKLLSAASATRTIVCPSAPAVIVTTIVVIQG